MAEWTIESKSEAEQREADDRERLGDEEFESRLAIAKEKADSLKWDAAMVFGPIFESIARRVNAEIWSDLKKRPTSFWERLGVCPSQQRGRRFPQQETNVDKILIHLNDWNCRDKWYVTTVDFCRLFKAKWLETKDQVVTWDWFTTQVDYGDDEGKPCKSVTMVDMTLDELFLDFDNFEEGFEEWASVLRNRGVDDSPNRSE